MPWAGIVDTHFSSAASCCDVSLGDVMALAELELLPCPPEPPPLPAPPAAVTAACLFRSRISFLRCYETKSSQHYSQVSRDYDYHKVPQLAIRISIDS
jgi:hypothetical protein